MKALTSKIIALSVLVLIFIFFIYPSFKVFENSGAIMLDSMIFYTPDDAFTTLQKLGARGRSRYFFIVGVVDMIFPIIYGGLFHLLFVALGAKNNVWNRLAWTPSVIDALENFIILTMLGMYPEFNKTIALIGGVANGIKWLAVGAIISLILIMLIRLGIIRTNSNTPAKHNT